MYHRCCPEFHEAGWAEIIALTNAPKLLETLRSNSLELRKQLQRRSRPLRSDPQHGTELLEPSNSRSLIERMSSPPMENISMISLTADSSEPMRGLSDMTKLSGIEPQIHEELNFRTSQPLPTSMNPTSSPMVSTLTKKSSPLNVKTRYCVSPQRGGTS